jgi:3-methyladenine DNA glycosylase AlkD
MPWAVLLERFPQLVPQAFPWTVSANRWIRRVSAVCLIFSLRRGHALADALKVADVLLLDPDSMVQKGYGWMLKEATRSFPRPVMDFVMRHRREMPCTALRYAIEKLPPNGKRTAMERPI